MAPGPKLGQEEQKELLFKDLRSRGYQFCGRNRGTIGQAEELEGPAPYEMPPANSECLIFTRLTPDIRAKILRILFVRDSKIVPGPVRYKINGRYRDTTVKIYSYLWMDRRQNMYDGSGLPAYNGKPQGAYKVWVAVATSEQLAMIVTGEVKVDRNNQCKLPSTFDEKLGERVEHFICRRDPYPTMVINRASVWTTGILGINLLGTCRQFRDKGAPILYSNQFVIDTRGQAPFTHQRGVHEYDALNEHRSLVPGLNIDGTYPTHRQTMNAIDKMFDYKSMHQPFMRCDPLATFLRIIGRKNAGYIKSLTVQGFFKTAEKHGRFQNNRPITFAKILPLYATIIRQALPNLTKLAIYQGSNDELWEDDLESQLGMSDEERYDEVIGKVVNVLPNLQELQLANYRLLAPKKTKEGEGDGDKELTLPWGKALRWEGIVEQRYRQRKNEQKPKEERKAKQMEVDQYMRKGDNSGKRGGRGGRGQGRGGQQNQESRGKLSSSHTARYNASFAALVDNAAAAAGVDGAGSVGGRPSFKRGKKLTRGGNAPN